MATADDPLFILVSSFFPVRTKCHSVLATINLPPRKLQNVHSVFAPGMGKTVSMKGHTPPTEHDKISPFISANEGHALDNSHDSMHFHGIHLVSFNLYLLCTHPHV